MLVERRACSHLRPPAHAPLDHASLSFDGLLPPGHHAHVGHTRAVLLADRHERMHPVVASPLVEVPSTENPTTDCPMANRLHASAGRSWHRHQCRLLRPPSGHASRQHLHLAHHRPLQSSGRYVRSLTQRSRRRVRPTFWSTNTFPYGGAHAPYSRTTVSSSAPSFYKLSTSFWECANLSQVSIIQTATEALSG